MATVTLDTLVLQWEALKADFNRKWAPEIRAIQTATEQGETYDQVYSRYQAASDAVLTAFAELAAIRNSADSIFSEFGVPDFIAKTEVTNKGLTTFQNNLAISLGRAQRNQATATSTSQAASGGTASTPQTLGAASAVDPANANTAAGGQPSPGIPLGTPAATVTAIPGTAGRIAAGASGAIASPANFGTTAGFPQTAFSREDAGPTVAQNIRTSAQSQAQNSLGDVGPLPNLLDKYSSYTYNLALYLCTKNQYNSFATAGDGTTLSLPGDQLIARSGGGPIGANQRNQFFSDLDLGIDKLKINAAIGFNQSGQPTSTGDLSFTLVEPAGATFLYRLQSAVAALANKDPSVGRAFYSNTTYAMVIRFYGYDSAGNIVTVKSGYDSNDAAAAGESAGISKIFFFQLNDISTKIGARVVEYHVEGTLAASHVAKGAILGVSPARFELTGTNLNDIFNGILGTDNDTGATQDENPRAESSADADAQAGGFYGDSNKVSAQPSQNIPTRGLAQALNQEYLRLSRPNKQGTKVVEYPDEYRIIFASEELKNAKVVIPGLDNDLSRAAGVRPTDTKAENVRKNTSIAKNSKLFEILPGTPIIQWLDLMIRNTDYIKKQAKLLVSENTDADIQGEENFYGEKVNQPKSPILWYKIVPYIEIKQYDNLRKTYAYKITYVISDYYITDPKSPYFKRAPWPGPDKLYLYTFTGQNTSVLQYEQSFNYLYRQTFTDNAPLSEIAALPSTGQIGPGYAFRVVAETGKQGSLGDSTDIAARAAAGIYSPSDFADLKIKIVGDPDYLFQDYYNLTQAQLTREAYKRTGRQNGLNSNYGELYLQMTFLTGDDWNLYSGIVNVEPKAGYVRRVSNAYRVNHVTSLFQAGKFEQEIEATLLNGVDPERALVKGDYVAGASVGASPTVNTDTTDTDSTSARQETTETASQETGAFDTDGSNDLRTQEGGSSTVPQSSTGALPAPPPPFSSPLAERLQELGVQRDQFRRGLLPNQAQVGNDDAPPDVPYG
jgi:hypothetical protein